MSQFQFNLSLSKAFEKDGDKFVVADVSDTRLDYHDHHMTEKALSDMEGMLKNGFTDIDGKLQKVYLLPEHGSTFEIGYADDGQVLKDADGHYKLTATFKLIKDNPIADQLYTEVSAGVCKKQLSVGGDAIGHAYFDEELKKTLGSLDAVTRLEHVACTRPGKAAVASTNFIGSMLKGIEGDIHDQIEFAKKAMSNADRKKTAVLVWDNDRTHDMYIEGDKLYLNPIPEGDRMAAKVAMYDAVNSKFPYNREERKAVHDAAAAVLGKEHVDDMPYCWLCDRETIFANSKDESDAPKGNIAIAKTINKERLGAGETSMEVEKEIDALKGELAEIKGLIKSLAPAEAPAKAEGEIVKEKAATEPIITAQMLEGILKKNTEDLIAQLSKPGPRTNAQVAPGAEIIHKEASATGQSVADAATGEEGQLTEIQKAIAVKQDRLRDLEKQRDEIIAKRHGGIPFTAMENLNATNLEKEYGQVKTAISYMSRTGQIVK